jgi:hypothetical protein
MPDIENADFPAAAGFGGVGGNGFAGSLAAGADEGASGFSAVFGFSFSAEGEG